MTHKERMLQLKYWQDQLESVDRIRISIEDIFVDCIVSVVLLEVGYVNKRAAESYKEVKE
jgi:hypothetical protein